MRQFPSPFYSLIADLLAASAATGLARQGSYPPYNIEVAGDDSARLSLAVAGFSPEDLHIEEADGVLCVSGRHDSTDEDDKRRFVHRGIAARAFSLRFDLGQHVKAGEARLENGILSVDLMRIVPEEAKPKQIPIAVGGGERAAA